MATAEPAAPCVVGVRRPQAAEAVGYAGQDLAPAPQAVDVPSEPTFDLVPAQAPPAEAAVPTAVEPAVAAGPVVAAEPVVSAEPLVAAEPAAVPEQIVAPEPVVTVEPVATPVPVPAADDELRGLRTSLEASDARRVAAEQRADHAVAYAQQRSGRAQPGAERAPGQALQATEVQVRYRRRTRP